MRITIVNITSIVKATFHIIITENIEKEGIRKQSDAFYLQCFLELE